jgi:hypothetical protein
VIGLYLLFLAMLWLLISIVLAVVVSRWVSTGSRRTVVAIFLVAVLVVLPFVDQVVGAIQFKKICADNDGIEAKSDRAKGRTVYRIYIPPNEIAGTWLPVYETQWRFADAESGEILLSYRTFEAGPGFIRVAPLMFNPHCTPIRQQSPQELIKRFGMTLGERPSVLPQEAK